ncbi:MAG: LytR/AlgR family response regulator transcription factor [Coprobacillaceae bacterium]
MIPIYLCDDDKMIIKKLETIINNSILIQNYDMEIVLASTNPIEILKHKEANDQRSIYFLDVDLKHEKYDGFTLAKQIREKDTRGFIIFVTTHEELIFDTFKYRLEAMSYLIKDDSENLSKYIKDCLDEIHTLILNEKKDIESYYTVRNGDSVYQIPIQDILFFETSNANHRIILHTKNRILEFRGDLSSIEKEIEGSFYRVHRSYLIQLS